MAEKFPQFTSPRGTFVFPRLTGDADTKYNAAGEYSTKLRFVAGSDEANAMAAKLKPLHDAAVKAGKAEYAKLNAAVQKKNPFKIVPFMNDELDKESGEPTGNVVFNFKMTASGVRKKDNKPWSRKPAMFDAKRAPLAKNVSVWGGSEGKVTFEVMSFFKAAVGAGISLRLQAAQIIVLKSGGGKSASEYGFEEEDGFDGASANTTEDDAEQIGGESDVGAEAGDAGNPDF